MFRAPYRSLIWSRRAYPSSDSTFACVTSTISNLISLAFPTSPLSFLHPSVSHFHILFYRTYSVPLHPRLHVHHSLSVQSHPFFSQPRRFASRSATFPLSQLVSSDNTSQHGQRPSTRNIRTCTTLTTVRSFFSRSRPR